jgi:hypothetical protein
MKIENTESAAFMFSGKNGDKWSIMICAGDVEICKTEAEALEAAELLKAFFEAKQEGKKMVLIEPHYMADLESARREGYQTAMLEMQQAQSQPSDYQLRLERYAVDIWLQLQRKQRDVEYQLAVNVAAEIMAIAAQKARKHGTQPD